MRAALHLQGVTTDTKLENVLYNAKQSYIQSMNIGVAVKELKEQLSEFSVLNFIALFIIGAASISSCGMLAGQDKPGQTVAFPSERKVCFYDKGIIVGCVDKVTE